MKQKLPNQLIVAFKSAGEMASGIAWFLYQSYIRRLLMMEIPEPLAVRREVAFCEALVKGKKVVEGVEAVKAAGPGEIRRAWELGQIPVIVDPRWTCLPEIRPDVAVDAILAKRNLGTTMSDAPLVIGLGPGFTAGRDAHMVIETNRGHNLGRIIISGEAERNTGVPGSIGGYTAERVLRASSNGRFRSSRRIGDEVQIGEIVGEVNGEEVRARIGGVIRGLILSGVQVRAGLKLGDIDPRGNTDHCYTISDKARAIGGAVLGAIMRVYNK